MGKNSYKKTGKITIGRYRRVIEEIRPKNRILNLKVRGTIGAAGFHASASQT